MKNKIKNKQNNRIFDLIKLENIKSDINSYDFTIYADVFVNGKKFKGFCDVLTFLEDEHRPVSIMEKPMPYFQFYCAIKKRIELIEGLELENIKLLKSYQRRSAKKRNKKKLKKLYLDKRYQERRSIRNFHYQYSKTLSSSYLDSCSCGIAECSGINNGVTIHRKPDGIVYKVNPIYHGYKNGILGSNKNKLYISNKNIKELRQKINASIKEAKEKQRSGDFEEEQYELPDY